MRCKDAKKLIPLHAGGDLDLEAGILDAHVASCPACAAELAAMRRTIGALRFAGKAALRPDPAAFASGIDERLRMPAAASTRFPAALRATFAAVASAAAVAAVLAAMYAFEAPKTGQEDLAQPQTAVVAAQAADVPLVVPRGGRTVVFGLSSSSLEPLSGADLELTATLVPDPSAREHQGSEDFMLREFTPVDDTEVSVDF